MSSGILIASATGGSSSKIFLAVRRSRPGGSATWRSQTMRDPVPALDVLRLAWRRSHVRGAGAYQPAEPLLLQDVRAPPGHPGAGEHRGEHVRRHFGEVE